MNIYEFQYEILPSNTKSKLAFTGDVVCSVSVSSRYRVWCHMVKKAQKKNPLGGNLMSSTFKKTFKVIISRKEAKNNGNA